jgi:hypothetical protein
MEVTKETLIALYVDDGLSTRAIGKITGRSEEGVRRLLIAHGIPRRSKTERFGGWNKGKTLPKGQRSKLSETRRKAFAEGSLVHWGKGRACPRETRAKISAALLNGRQASPSYYGPDWRIQRTTCLQRDQFTCQQCESTERLEVHHWEPYRFSFDNSLDNLVTLCEACHRDIHEMYRREGFIAEAEGSLCA